MNNCLFLFLFGYLCATEEIMFNNSALFEKSVHLQTETNINTLVVAEGCNINQKESSIDDPLLITINNLSINTTQTAETNILNIGDSENTYPTTIQFTNLLDATETQNQLKHVGIDNDHQVYIYIDETPPDPSTLKADIIITDKLYGNDADTLFFQANDKAIAIGNHVSDLTCIGDKVIFTSPIKTNNQNGFHFIAQLATNILSCPTIKIDHLSMGLQKGKSNFINTNNTFIENITVEKNFTLGQTARPLDLLHITAAQALQGFSFGPLDQTTPITITLNNTPAVTTMPGILALQKVNNQVIFATPTFSNVVTDSIECETWENWSNDIVFRAADEIILNTYGSPWTSNNPATVILFQFWKDILLTATVRTLAVQNVAFSTLTLDNFTSSKQNNNCNCTINKFNISNIATINCNNTVYFYGDIYTPPSEYQRYRYLTRNATTGQLTKSYDRLPKYQSNDAISLNTSHKLFLQLQPKIFSYRSSYCTDICKKTKQKRERIGFLVEDLVHVNHENFLQFDHNHQIINYDSYILGLLIDDYLSEIKNSLKPPQKNLSLEITDKKIEELENINQLYSENLRILEEIAKQLKEM